MKKINLLIFNILIILFYEIIFNLLVIKTNFGIDCLYVFIFSVLSGIIITLLESLVGQRLNKIISIIINVGLFIIYFGQMIHYKFYDSIFSLYSMVNGGQVFEFYSVIIKMIINNYVVSLLYLLPLVLFIILYKKLSFSRNSIRNFILIFVLILVYSGVVYSFSFFKDSVYSYNNLFYKTHAPTLSVQKFGLLTTMYKDLERVLTGFEESSIINKPVLSNEETVEKTVTYNTMDINFEDLINKESNQKIKDIHEYFNGVSPTNQNEYTGIFEGYNLIAIVAEAFSPLAIDEKLTPTLYKMYRDGFQFENFYTPVFFVSTSDGEYSTLTSLIPKEGVWSMSKSSKNYLPFVYGNMFKELGYETRAYHNGSYTYYDRNNSHPNMGYDYKACYHGLNINCKSWPQSDVEMVETTTSEYINSEHFMTYYMTVSGHLQYNFSGNRMAMKNKSLVTDLPYSKAVQAYMATQIELDRALEKLLYDLEVSGKLDNTVIILSADHYPYGLTTEQMVEKANYINDPSFDIHKNSFLIYNSKTKGATVSKYASSLDILPTVLNMFGMEYDSRLLMGRDIFSDSEGIVIFNNRSFITDSGKYNSINKTFTPYYENIDDDYVEKMTNLVYNKFVMSKLVLENNYYKYVFE